MMSSSRNSKSFQILESSRTVWISRLLTGQSTLVCCCMPPSRSIARRLEAYNPGVTALNRASKGTSDGAIQAAVDFVEMKLSTDRLTSAVNNSREIVVRNDRKGSNAVIHDDRHYVCITQK